MKKIGWITGRKRLLYTGRHFWNRKCRKKTWWQQEFAVFKCEATANAVTGHVCVNSNSFTSAVKFFTDFMKLSILYKYVKTVLLRLKAI